MKRLLLLAAALTLWPLTPSFADPVYFKAGPLELSIPFKSARATYMYDFNANQNLVGGETPFISFWNRIEGTLGAVTSLEGQGTPFVGGNILVGNVLEKYLTLPADLTIGGFGGWNFHLDQPIYGFKASVRIW
jgi:hypothetical protein